MALPKPPPFLHGGCLAIVEHSLTLEKEYQKWFYALRYHQLSKDFWP